MSYLRYERATIYPAIEAQNSRGATVMVPDRDNPIEGVRVGISSYESTTAELFGHVTTETTKMRIPYRHKGRSLKDVSPGAIIVWDGSEWDVAIPAKIRNTRTHSTRHYTIEIKRRPATPGVSP